MLLKRFLENRFVCALAIAGLPFMAASAHAAPVFGGTTTVTLDTGTVGALTGLGFGIAPVTNATLGGVPLAATFPITGGDTTTAITHSGGLAFTKSGSTADVQNFIINLSGAQAGIITGQLVAGGSTTNGVSLFDIGSGLNLTLNAQLAGILSSAFGVPNLTGAAIGTAAVNPSAAPEPGSVALTLTGLLASFYFLRNRTRRHAEV